RGQHPARHAPRHLGGQRRERLPRGARRPRAALPRGARDASHGEAALVKGLLPLRGRPPLRGRAPSPVSAPRPGRLSGSPPGVLSGPWRAWPRNDVCVCVFRPGSFVAAVILACALLFPAVADAQGGSTNPFSPGLPPTPATTPTAPQSTTPVITNPTSTTSSGGGGLSGSGAAAIAIGAIIVLGGIAFFIWRDARRRAPLRRRAAAATAGASDRSHPGSKARPKPRK